MFAGLDLDAVFYGAGTDNYRDMGAVSVSAAESAFPVIFGMARSVITAEN